MATEVRYNHCKDGELPFRAEVHFMSREELGAELKILRDEIKDAAKPVAEAPSECDDSQIDGESEQRREELLSKFKSIWPYLRNEHDFMKKTCEQLLDDPCVRNRLGSCLELNSATHEDFRDRVRPYLDANGREDENEAEHRLLPLINSVKLFVVSELLKDGIVLVDMPGNNDVSAARCAIADNYQQKLDLTCVFAKSTRAATERSVGSFILEKMGHADQGAGI